MSKAFVKEDDLDSISDSSDELDAAEERARLPAGAKNYITPQGMARLKAELHSLLCATRPELVKTVAWAASNGDRSENGDYIYGKRKLREIDRRIRFLTKRLEAAEIVDPEKQSSDRVLFGATVTVENESGEEQQYSIVGIDESDPSRHRVSWISPVAKALLNARVGEVVTLRTPRGEEELEVIRIEYLSLGE